MDKIQSLFTDEEWEILLGTYREVFEPIKEVPLHFKEMNVIEGDNNE